MLIKRTIVSLILAAIGIPAILAGHDYFFTLIAVMLIVAAWEYGRLFETSGFRPSQPLLLGGVAVVLWTRYQASALAAAGTSARAAAGALAFCALAAMAWHLVDYEKGRDQAGTDFAITVAGILYLGWIGAYLIDLRELPDGLWWLLLVLPAVWWADTAAYFFGRAFGKHALSPRLSPKKTWEGYWAGVVFGTLGTAGLALLWHAIGGPAVLWWKAAALGAALSVLTTLGDLGESMFKRQAGVKDSSNIMPGHGGFLDRMDSWLWGGVIGYFLIVLFML